MGMVAARPARRKVRRPIPTAREVDHGRYGLRPIANRLSDERTYITPSDNAGVAISISPIEFVADGVNFPPGRDDQHLPVFVREVELAVSSYRRRAEAAADERQSLPIISLAGLQVVGVKQAVVGEHVKNALVN